MCEEERNKLSQSYMGTVYSEPLLLLAFFFFHLIFPHIVVLSRLL